MSASESWEYATARLAWAFEQECDHELDKFLLCIMANAMAEADVLHIRFVALLDAFRHSEIMLWRSLLRLDQNGLVFLKSFDTSGMLTFEMAPLKVKP